MENIDIELVTIVERAQRIVDEVGQLDPQYEQVYKWMQDITIATQSINNKIKTK